MSKNIPKALRAAVAKRAAFRCEYCRRPESDSFIRYQSDHIISRKHGGKTTLKNLAWACPVCNNHKGSDLVTILEDEEVAVRLFHPRKHDWFEHFEVVNGGISGKTVTGEATARLLKFNEPERILERLDLIKAGLFP